MTESTLILVVDDDKMIQKILTRTLSNAGFMSESAMDGEAGLRQAVALKPDIILLDVEMPGMNGYEVCEKIRSTPAISDIPVVFLSSHSSLRERMQGYEVGADDYIIKPFETDHLVAKLKVLLKYREQAETLAQQYESAKKVAMEALTGSGELGLAMHYAEKVHSMNEPTVLSQGFFNVTQKLGLDVCLLLGCNEQQEWFCAEGTIKPLEKELLEMVDKNQRFVDFGHRTIINYPTVSCLIKEMPLDDMERYGRLKDLIPVMLSAIDNRIQNIKAERALLAQSEGLLSSLARIRTFLYYLTKGMLSKQEQSFGVLRNMASELQYDLLRMGLEEDQEDFLMHRIDTAIDDAVEVVDAGEELATTFTAVLSQFRAIMSTQRELVEKIVSRNQQAENSEFALIEDDDIELF